MLWRAAAAGGGPAPHGHPGHGMGGGAAVAGHGAWPAEIFWWLVMIAAMMFPLVLGPVRITAARSLWRRRHRAIGGFLAGYLGPWMLFGVVASVVVSWLQTQTRLQPATAAAAGFGAALLWQGTALKRRALGACHRTLPIAPSGWRADRDCLRYGWAVGRSCLLSCWALMLACVLTGHSPLVMVGTSAICWAERNTARPRHLLLCAVVGVLAIAYVLAHGN